MPTFTSIFRFGFVLLLALTGAFAADPEPESAPAPAVENVEDPAVDDAAVDAMLAKMSFAEKLKMAGVNVVTGPIQAKLGTVAQLDLPAGYHFIGTDSLERFYELTENIYAGNEVGVIIAPDNWMLFFDYDDVGYIKDDDKDALDGDKLMASMTENQAEANTARKERGWDEMKVRGWVKPPHYDERTHNLKWSFNLSSSSDDFASTWINQNIRLLGRAGVMNVTLVGDPETFAAADIAADALLSDSFTYVEGQRYAEFRKGDKVAEYGLAALVLGGAGAVAAKTGLLAKLGLLLAKGWKLIVIAFIAVGSFLKKLLNKITGRNPSSAPDAE